MERLSWNEIRLRATKFAEEWKDAKYERGETQTFYNEFFQIFGLRRRKVASFEEPVKKLGNAQGFIDLFWKGVLLVEQKSKGGNLVKAKQQAFDYFPGIKDSELPRYILACDFQTFRLTDLEEGTENEFSLADLPNNVEHFGFVLGITKKTFRDQDPVNIEASRLMGRLHDELYKANYKGHDLERFLVRLLFCLFADDTGIFEPVGIFEDYIRDRTAPDGSDLGPKLTHLFQVLNDPPEMRDKNLDEDLSRFQYINGDLFAQQLRMPSFNSRMRDLLLEACAFNWNAISPAIFGALFQHVSGDVEARRAHGEHYTTEKNILKVIEPLFLEELRAELDSILKLKEPETKLGEFQKKIASLKFFDPACGCGNFLIIAYREMRELEIIALKNLYEGDQQILDVGAITKVDVDQFYGIEINEFPARIAEVAMWMMDHIMNNRLSVALGQMFARIPIKKAPNIVHGDALTLDWNQVLPASECDYILGNPPFLGSKVQSELQRQQVRDLAALGKSGGTLDFVCAWYFKAGAYSLKQIASKTKKRLKIGLVSTNSITQGEQVAQFWPIIFNRYGLEIYFAHRTFRWGSDVNSVAHVHVVILGLGPTAARPSKVRLFDYPDVAGDPHILEVDRLTPYLLDGSALVDPHLVVSEVSEPITDARPLKCGTQPIDDGHYIFTREEGERLLSEHRELDGILRPYIGSLDFINGNSRYLLCPSLADVSIQRDIPLIRERMEKVSAFRLKSGRKGTQAIAKSPAVLNITVIPDGPFLCIPGHTSEKRDYIPIGYLKPPVVPSNAVFVLLDASIFDFAVLTSKMHMAWMKEIGGRLESRYRYSIGVVYNNFPWPDVTDSQKKKLSELGKAILDARANHPGASLADLYDPVTMPPDLRKAHDALDKAVDQLYRKEGFKSDRERVEHLLGLYEGLVSPLARGMAAEPARGRRRRR